MKVITVRSKKDKRDFIRLPQAIFRDHPCFVPPLWTDEKKGYSARGNPILSISDFELLLAVNDDGRPVGRTIVYVDHSYNRHYAASLGFFGAFECIDDGVAARMLIQAAEDWLRSKGMAAIRGPINPVAENWGFVFDGYDKAPVYMSPWNPDRKSVV